MNTERLHKQVRLILSGGRPLERQSRVDWIRETARAHEIEAMVDAFMLDAFATTDVEDLDDDQIARLHRYIFVTIEISRNPRALGIE